MPTPIPPIPSIATTPRLLESRSRKPAQPAVLFPARLETRFFPQPDGRYELRIRVYPDRIHIDSHEPELTPEELKWGQHFWKQAWRAGNDAERRKAAWRQLADRFDPPRASWVARALRPLNPEERPATPLPDEREPLPTPPRFPAPAMKEESWTRPPHARVLPSFWFALGYKGGALVFEQVGRMVPDKLPTGPSPRSGAADASDDQLAIDEQMKWLVDFDAAEQVGMGLRVMMQKQVAEAGLDFLLVFGLKISGEDEPEDFTPLLAELFDAHHYTSGLSFVPPGTPSNNTEEAPSGFSSNDPGHETSYASEIDAPGVETGGDSNAAALAAAFGLRDGAQLFANLPHAGATERLDAHHMNNALWQVSWGYFLLQMLGVGRAGESPLNDADIEWAREHFVRHVRAGGPLPTLRVGTQPYGVLPVTSLDAWKPPPGQEGEFARDVALRDFLGQLRGIWRRNLDRVPRLGRNFDDERGVDDVDRDMAEVLSMDGQSSSYSIRHLMGRHYAQNLWSFLGADLDAHGWWAKQEELTTGVLRSLGAAWRPRLAYGVYWPLPAKLGGPLVQAGPAENAASLSPNYIESLLAAPTVFDITAHHIKPQSPPPTLLYFLLRHSMTLEYVSAANRLLIQHGLLQSGERRELELVNFPGLPTRILMEPFGKMFNLPGVPHPLTVEDFMLGLVPEAQPIAAREPLLKPVNDLRASMRYLQELAPARLEQLMAGTLDLCSHRLDAWITSFATKRLAEMRGTKPAGALVGGYGWVMNLRPNPPGTPFSVEEDPAAPPAKNPGFTHAPSLTQATAAAVLRSGHLTHSGEAGAGKDNPLEIDLTSERVRLAQWLLDGVRQGQPLGALLGYRFERRLQEQTVAQGMNVAQFIARFRELAPLVARKLEPTTLSVENVAANNVVDGLALSRRWQKVPPPHTPHDTRLRLLFGAPLSQGMHAHARFLAGELDVLVETVDAVGDALLAESVYQVVRGNPLRAASTVESVAGGETPPPELEFARTPRTGVALTHRLLALFGGEQPAPPPGWGTPAHPHRAQAEPHLNAWAARLLGNPADVRCLVERLDPQTGEVVRRLDPQTGRVVEPKEFRLDRLRLAPLDFIYALEGGQGGGQAEIEQRIIHAITRAEDGFAPGSVLRVSTARSPEWKAHELSYGEFSEVLRTARKLLNGLRAVDAGDLNLPERGVASGVVPDESEGRAADAGKSLRGTLEEFTRQLAAPAAADLDALRELMLGSAAFGVGGAVPLSAAGDSPADRRALLAQAESIRKELAQRDEQLTALVEGFDAANATDEARRDHAVARLRVVFGKSFVVLPRFRVAGADADELALALNNSTQVQDGDPTASTEWFLRMARVRDGVARLDAALSNAEAVNAGERLKLSVAQLPHGPAKERWVALPLKPEPLKPKPSLPGGKLSLVVQEGAPFDVRLPLAGVLFDEWVEVVPSASETTGISFQYDQPNAAPPQTILVAVPPEPDAAWTTWSLQKVLLETLDLARIRAVDPDALGEVGHYLPALYLAHNRNNLHAVTTDLSKLR